MVQFLTQAGFVNIKIEVKENAADIIKGWMPGSGAEKFVSSAYVTAFKPTGSWGIRDDARGQALGSSFAASPSPGGCCAPQAPAADAAKPSSDRQWLSWLTGSKEGTEGKETKEEPKKPSGPPKEQAKKG